MRTNRLWLFLFVMLLFALPGCDKSDSTLTSSGPSLQLTTSELHWIANKELHIKGGVVANEVGIESIRIQMADWSLDKIITFKDSIVKSYALDYKFLVPVNASVDKTYEIKVTVTDRAGNTKDAIVKVMLDGDFAVPVFAIAPDANLTLVVAPKTETFRASFTLTDNKDLAYLLIKSGAPLNISDSIVVSGTSAVVSKDYVLPNTLASYNFSYTLVDKAGNKTASASVITISEMPDFEKMYLSDVKTANELNSDLFGVPMVIEHTGAYSYEAKYYSAAANTEIKFIPQKTDFQPNCFGVDPKDKTTIINDPINALPIVLPEVGYYKISLNIKTGSYSVAKYTPTDVTPNSMTYDLDGVATAVKIGLIGTGFADHAEQNWSPNSAILLTQSTSNPYQYSVNVTLSGSVQFIVGPYHPWNWWPDPFWRFDSKTNPEKAVKGGGDNVDLTVATPTKYTFIFDSHLNRAKMILNNAK